MVVNSASVWAGSLLSAFVQDNLYLSREEERFVPHVDEISCHGGALRVATTTGELRDGERSRPRASQILHAPTSDINGF
jgi:hypothetical protein